MTQKYISTGYIENIGVFFESNFETIPQSIPPHSEGNRFNTLAQLGTTCENEGEIAPHDMPTLTPVTRKEQTRTLEKRAKSKYFSHSFAKQLLKASGGRGPLSNAYRRTIQSVSYTHLTLPTSDLV